MELPFRIAVYDKAFRRLGWVGDPVALTVTPRHNALGTCTLTLASDHRRLPDLTARGARVVVDYDGQQLLSGPVRRLRGRGPGAQGQVEVDVEDDFRLLSRVLGWPRPAAAIGLQTAPYDVRTGPAESIAKAYVAANTTRLGLPVTIAPDQTRGQVVRTKLRMHPLADKLLPLLELAGLGITVRQVGAGLVVDCYTPAVHPRTLSERSGVVQDWQWSTAGPTATRVVVGDQGQAEARAFTLGVDSALEAAYGDVVEVFRDARDTDDPAQISERINETLSEGGPTAGLSVTLAETDTFRYGRAVRVGDRVRLEVGPGVVVQDVLREAVLSWTTDDGLSVTSSVGEPSDNPDTTLARGVASITRAVRSLRSER